MQRTPKGLPCPTCQDYGRDLKVLPKKPKAWARELKKATARAKLIGGNLIATYPKKGGVSGMGKGKWE